MGGSKNSSSSDHATLSHQATSSQHTKLSNSYSSLFLDDELDGEKVERTEIASVKGSRRVKDTNKAGNSRVNKYPENDDKVYTNKPKHIPGNSSYANITQHGKKIAIFSDSTTSRIRMGEFNSYVEKGRAFRKNFPGATPNEVAHYCTHTLEEQQPDMAIIHVGTNALYKDDTCKIAEDVLKIVKICKNYGVNSVFVSGLTYRRQFKAKIDEINTFISARQLVDDFEFICNENINERDIWKDKIHLSDQGTVKLANNFLRAINSAQSL